MMYLRYACRMLACRYRRTRRATNTNSPHTRHVVDTGKPLRRRGGTFQSRCCEDGRVSVSQLERRRGDGLFASGTKLTSDIHLDLLRLQELRTYLPRSRSTQLNRPQWHSQSATVPPASPPSAKLPPPPSHSAHKPQHHCRDWQPPLSPSNKPAMPPNPPTPSNTGAKTSLRPRKRRSSAHTSFSQT